MIVSHTHRFIFVKTRKTAGTSIEIALSRFCGPDDIITAISPEDEGLRQQLGYRSAQNDLLPFRRYSAGRWRQLLTEGRRARLYNHMRADMIRSVVGPSVWDRYYTFTVERNPFDRAVSVYYWETRDADPRPTISEFLRTSNAKVLSNYDHYSIDGVPAVDRIVRFENLTSDLEEVRLAIGLPEPLTLPHSKGGLRRSPDHYSVVLSDGDRQVIERTCAREIALLGYTFESAPDVPS